MSCWTLNFINFERIQQINLIFSFLTLNMYLPVGHRIKLAKQFQCTLNNRAVSLKHIHVAGVRQHGLSNPWTIESNVHMIIVTGLSVWGGWAGWKFLWGRGPRVGYEGRGPDNPNTHFKKSIQIYIHGWYWSMCLIGGLGWSNFSLFV